ncbi:hypothetical protein, partial [Dysgonomonas macrotermitis]|uniref:hypothetical protein n=1 Tax=Dysgonomonas macrotermitis TaxID=1346286 RepID=UPI0012F97296
MACRLSCLPAGELNDWLPGRMNDKSIIWLPFRSFFRRPDFLASWPSGLPPKIKKGGHDRTNATTGR